MTGQERRERLRAEVLAQVIEVMSAAKAAGRRDYYTATEAAFPGIPQSVLVEADLALDQRAEDAWWERLEKTIDAEVLHRALALVTEGGE